MAAAAILSLEEFRDTQRHTAVRQRLHDHFDVWLNTLEARMEDRLPTLAELTKAVFALRQELTRAMTKGLVKQAHRVTLAQRTVTCRQCGHMLSTHGPQERTVETMVGALRLRRPYFVIAQPGSKREPTGESARWIA